jgi:hypothetical protein
MNSTQALFIICWYHLKLLEWYFHETSYLSLKNAWYILSDSSNKLVLKKYLSNLNNQFIKEKRYFCWLLIKYIMWHLFVLKMLQKVNIYDYKKDNTTDIKVIN